MPQQVGMIGLIGFIVQFAIMAFQEYLRLTDENAKAKSDAEKQQITYDGIAATVLAKMKADNQAEKKTDDGLQNALDGALKPAPSSGAPALPGPQTTSTTPSGSPTK